MINPFAENIFGYGPGELNGKNTNTLIPKRLYELHSIRAKEYYENPVQRFMDKGIEFSALKKNQTEFPVDIALCSYEIDKEIKIVCFVSDITERKKIENQLRNLTLKLELEVRERTRELSQVLDTLNQTNNELKEEINRSKQNELKVCDALEKEKELNDLKSRFISMASHEFRTPLGIILTSVSLLANYTSSETQDKRDRHIYIIKKSIKNLTAILDDFLTLDKLDQEEIHLLKPTYFNIEDFLKSIIEEVKTSNDEIINISYHHTGPLRELYVDSCMLRNILIYLISNATKYSSSESPIQIETQLSVDQLKIAIKDQGVGIPEEEQKNIFERFFRASNVTTIQGTGLGLNIVKKYLDFMGGEMTFQSKENEGTTFIITIPIETNK